MSGPVLIPGKSAESQIIRMIEGLEDKKIMPPAGPRLTKQEIGVLRAWIDQGAKWPDVPKPLPRASPAQATGPFSRSPVLSRPRTGNDSWARNPD